MQDFFVTAKIRTDLYSNTGIIHIKDDLIEGIFTLDYVRILLDGKKMSLILTEHHFDFSSDYRIIKSSIEKTIYESNYNELYIESPLSYLLFNASGECLRLALSNPIKDPKVVSQILEKLEKFKS